MHGYGQKWRIFNQFLCLILFFGKIRSFSIFVVQFKTIFILQNLDKEALIFKKSIVRGFAIFDISDFHIEILQTPNNIFDDFLKHQKFPFIFVQKFWSEFHSFEA